MLQIRMPLTSSEVPLKNDNFVLMPMAGVDVNVDGKEKHVDINLAGVISGGSAEALQEFLKGVAGFLGTRWTLQMTDLSVISTRGLQTLIQFSRLIQERGCRLEVRGVSQSVYAT